MDNARNIWLDGIMGVIVGDALGCPVQFMSRKEIVRRPQGPVTGMEGYEFVGWDPKVSDRVTSSITYTAQWKEIEKPEPEPEPTPEIIEVVESPKTDPPTRAIEPPVEEEVKTWSLINLILLFGTIFTLVNIGSNKKYNIFSFIFVICSILMFIWFEDVHSHMILVNKYTIIMVLLYAAQLLSRILAKDKDQDKDEDDSVPEDSI